MTASSKSPKDAPTSEAALKGRKTAQSAALGLLAAVAVAGGAAAITFYLSESDAWVGAVNGVKLHRDDYKRDVDIRKKQYLGRLGTDFNSETGRQMEANLKKDVLDQLIDREILIQAAAARKLSITSEEVETRARAIRSGFPDDQTFQRSMQEYGITDSVFREQLRSNLLIERLRDEVSQGATASLADALKAYQSNLKQYSIPEQVKASHILIKTEKKARELKQELKTGADFASLAKAHTEDAGSRDQGGDLGNFGRGKMVPEFEAVAFKLRPGQVSEPVKSPFGFHLIKVQDHKVARTRAFDEVREDILQNMVGERKNDAFRLWMGKQKAAAKVEVRPQYQTLLTAPTPAPLTGVTLGKQALPAHKSGAATASTP